MANLDQYGVEHLISKIKNVISTTFNSKEITYSKLKELRDSGKLIPGQQYRITDYITTTIQENTESAGHQFDIIVTATSNNTLSEIASACLHEGDTYFSNYNANLSAWQIWYCIDNDAGRFEWADYTNGKGIIYRMIDEWGNDCPYDFKNIKFTIPIFSETDTPDSNFYYTFSFSDNSDIKDYSVFRPSYDNVYNNVIKPYIDTACEQSLNRILFISYAFVSRFANNTFGGNCRNNKLGAYCENNTFGGYCENNKFDGICHSNTFGNYCSGNTFGNYCQSNTFGNYCESNTFGNNCKSNTFGNNCISNTFGNWCGEFTLNNITYNGNYFYEKCSYNLFGDYCGGNNFNVSCKSNTFGNDCYSNKFGENCSSNTFGTGCNNNTFGIYCRSNTFGTNCSNNTFGTDCNNNTFGAVCYGNKFGNSCHYNTFGNSCLSNTFGAVLNGVKTIKSYYRNIIFDNGNSYIYLNCEESTGTGKYYQNVRIGLGVNGLTYKTINDSNVNQDYETLYSTSDSKTINV